MFKVIVAGGRDFSDYQLLSSTLDRLLSRKPEVEIVSGAAVVPIPWPSAMLGRG